MAIFFYNIWKEIEQPILPYRFCGRNIFSFPENLAYFFVCVFMYFYYSKQSKITRQWLKSQQLQKIK